MMSRPWKECLIIEERAVFSRMETVAVREEHIALPRFRILKINCYKLAMLEEREPTNMLNLRRPWA
jgi:hypothetical protein